MLFSLSVSDGEYETLLFDWKGFIQLSVMNHKFHGDQKYGSIKILLTVTGTYCRTGCRWQYLIQKDRQYTNDTTLRCIRANFAAVKITNFTYSECVCSLMYPACNPHAQYCHLCPVRHKIFFHIISQTARFSKKSSWTRNMCFDFLYNSRGGVFDEEISPPNTPPRESYRIILSELNDKTWWWPLTAETCSFFI